MTRIAHFRSSPSEPPLIPDPETPEDTGWSELAVRSGKDWDAKDRPKKWRGNEYGLIIHTTGSQLPLVAQRNGRYPTVRAENWYSGSHGCHYITGYQGHRGGDLIQMAHESERANGVGTTETRAMRKARLAGDFEKKAQKQSIQGLYGGSWQEDLTPALVKRIGKRWPGYPDPLSLYPAAPNACGVHMECPPLNKYWRDQGHDPAFPGSYFTMAQYETIAALAVDLALRKGWPDQWWRTPRLLGHEDLTPVSRHDKRGGWDPGATRSSPRFNWSIVIMEICSILDVTFSSMDLVKLAKGVSA